MQAVAQKCVCLLCGSYRDVLLGVHKVLHECLLLPGDARGLVGLGVVEAGLGASGAAKEAEQVGALLVSAALVVSVALCTLGLEDLGSLRKKRTGREASKQGKTTVSQCEVEERTAWQHSLRTMMANKFIK